MAKNSARIGKEEEPSFAPAPGKWYDISLGPSFSDHSPSSKFCTLRYEFKPASVDKSQPGLLHKKDNRVTVEFQNNQHGKPNVIFEGVGEDYKDNDAVLFFDGETFRLERLHRAVKRLRHVRVSGESTASAAAFGPIIESNSPPPGKAANPPPLNKGEPRESSAEVERIDIGNLGALGVKPEEETTTDMPPPFSTSSKILPDLTSDEVEEHVDVVDNEDGHETTEAVNLSRREIHSSIDINVPHQNRDDDEIADVDVSDDEDNPGYNAAEALRAQVAGERREEQSSSSTGSSESDSSGSGSESSSGSGSRTGSGSSGSDSESSDGESVTSI